MSGLQANFSNSLGSTFLVMKGVQLLPTRTLGPHRASPGGIKYLASPHVFSLGEKFPRSHWNSAPASLASLILA